MTAGCSMAGRWLFFFISMAAYTFLSREFTVQNAIIKKVIHFIARHSFTEYMLHFSVLYKITLRIVAVETSAAAYFGALALTVSISLFLAVILDTCVIFPLQRAMKKILLKPDLNIGKITG